MKKKERKKERNTNSSYTFEKTLNFNFCWQSSRETGNTLLVGMQTGPTLAEAGTYCRTRYGKRTKVRIRDDAQMFSLNSRVGYGILY